MADQHYTDEDYRRLHQAHCLTDERRVAAEARAEALQARLDTVEKALKEAEGTLALYADPTGYTDQHEDPYSEDDPHHPGMAAAETLRVVRTALKGGEDGGEAPYAKITAR